MTATQQGWKRRERPPRLERRLEFDEYEQTRDFLDAVAAICEPGGYFPDISFGRTYANITIHAEPDAADIDTERLALADRIEALTSLPPTPDNP
jgi:4a-hydroxytetrahydrobiopterin dehydratase